MAACGGLSIGQKPSGFPSSQQVVFKRFILKFVQSLCKNDRTAFRYWCKELIPVRDLDRKVDDDDDIFKLIELLQDHNQLLLDDMFVLKTFLSGVERCDLLIELEKAELSIVVGKILEHYKVFCCQRSSTGDFYAEVVGFMVSRIPQRFEHVRRICSDKRVFLYLDGEIHKYLMSPGCTWSRVTIVLMILAELSADGDKDVQTTIDLLADSMYKLGGMVSVYTK